MAETTPQDLVITQGDTWTIIFEWLDSNKKPIDLTNVKACMQFRGGFRHPVALSLDSETGGLVLGGTTGRVTATIEDEQSSAMNITSGIYDLKINYLDGTRATLAKGNFKMEREVSKCR